MEIIAYSQLLTNIYMYSLILLSIFILLYFISIPFKSTKIFFISLIGLGISVILAPIYVAIHSNNETKIINSNITKEDILNHLGDYNVDMFNFTFCKKGYLLNIPLKEMENKLNIKEGNNVCFNGYREMKIEKETKERLKEVEEMFNNINEKTFNDINYEQECQTLAESLEINGIKIFNNQSMNYKYNEDNQFCEISIGENIIYSTKITMNQSN